MLKLWNKPCPVQANMQHVVLVSFVVGLFISLFLSLFQPFGIHKLPADDKPGVFAGYGAITTAIMLLYGSWLYFYINHDPGREAKWTVKNQILYVLLQISTIAAANFLFSSWIGITTFSLEGFFFYMGVTFAIGFFPTVALTLFGYAHALKKHLAIATAANTQLDQRLSEPAAPAPANVIHLSGENKDEALSIPHSNLLYIAAAGNYAEVHWLNNGKIQKSLLRSSLSRMEDQLKTFSTIERCHRSYLVNIALVDHVSGNAQGYQLHLKGIDQEVPVGRTFAPAILKEIGQ